MYAVKFRNFDYIMEMARVVFDINLRNKEGKTAGDLYWLSLSLNDDEMLVIELT